MGQTSRHVAWIREERHGRHEDVVGAVLAECADPKLRYSVKAHPTLSLWTYDRSFAITRVNL